ncbi:MAG: hypothetical protein J7527_07915 [Chitinophagaceae bacterium]|nr:hypothetical protein [Chitinophagaceae bacterium]
MKTKLVIFFTLLLPLAGISQYYQGLNGTYYIGSLNVHNNPSAIVNVPVKWDLTILGIQDKHSTNIATVHNYSLLSNPSNSEYEVAPGEYKRKGDANVNLNLLNFRLALNQRSAIAMGINFRSYTRARSSRYNFYDTLQSFRDFFVLNENNRDDMSVDMTSASWLEVYGTYGQTIVDNDQFRLNAGATLKINRGYSGAFAQMTGGSFSKTGSFPDTYLTNSVDLDFAYSDNYDRVDNGQGSNFKNFTSGLQMGVSADFGLELLIKRPYITNRQREEEYYDYDWKIGASLLDLGFSSYLNGQYSTMLSGLRTGITDETLDQKFDSTINSFGQFRDSLATLFNTVTNYQGNFKIFHPTRLVINIDKFISDAFFVNADLSLGVARIIPVKNNRLRDLSVFTLTPRWETKKKGFYLPVQYTSTNKLWVGGAVRYGPILFGLHNFANLFSKKRMQQGIGYLAIILKASELTGEKADKRLDCW